MYPLPLPANCNILQHCSRLSRRITLFCHVESPSRQGPSCCPFIYLPLLLLHPANPNLFSVSIISSFQECYRSGTRQYRTFWDWPFRSAHFFWSFIQAIHVPTDCCSLFLLSSLLAYGCSPV